jgi:hypothetical protein
MSSETPVPLDPPLPIEINPERPADHAGSHGQRVALPVVFAEPEPEGTAIEVNQQGATIVAAEHIDDVVPRLARWIFRQHPNQGGAETTGRVTSTRDP